MTAEEPRHSAPPAKPDAKPDVKSPAKPPVGVVERALLVLNCFTFDAPSLHLREIAAATALDKATVLRILGSFAGGGYVQRLGDGRYAPGPAALRLASVYNAVSDLNARMSIVLHRVMEQVGESAAFYRRHGDDRICVARANARRSLRYQVEVGHGVPLASGGAAAHVLLAHTGGRTSRTDEVLRQGFATTAAEREPELASVALPVFEADGDFLGSLVVSSPLSRQSAEAWELAREVAVVELRQQGFSSTPPCAQSASTRPQAMPRALRGSL